MKLTTHDYVAIQLWGSQTGSFAYYIEAQQEKAALAQAPVDALYERDGKWTCVSDLKADHPFRASYAEALKRISKPKPRKMSFRKERDDVGGGYGSSDY